jgi:uncharacterized 2Fe-2S/4Fe-4S cluster protein (DUF4445 family)
MSLMKFVNDFSLRLDQDKIFKTMNCHVDRDVYSEACRVFNKLQNEFNSLIAPKGMFTFTERTDLFELTEPVSKAKKILLAAVTLGAPIEDRIQLLFDEGEYLEAMMLDVIADELLFTMSNEMYEEIIQACRPLGLKLSCRVSPGDDSFPMSYQKVIFDALKADLNLGLEMTKAYMLKPVKSMMYMYGADETFSNALFNQSCENCENSKCSFREDQAITVFVEAGSHAYEMVYDPTESLLHTLVKKANLVSPCGGNGTCGKCKIKVLEGELQITESDIKKLTDVEIREGYRLACCAFPSQNCRIEIKVELAQQSSIITDFIQNRSELHPWVETRKVVLPENRVERSSAAEWIEEAADKRKISLNALYSLSEILVTNKNPETLFLSMREDEVLDITTQFIHAFGIVVDIGTTTIVVGLVNLNTGEWVDRYSVLNSQKKYGSDVVTRIQYASQKKSNLTDLTAAVQNDILEGIKHLCKVHDIEPNLVRDMVVSGNTTMLHLLMGIQCKTIGSSPFLAVTLNKHNFGFFELFNHGLIHANVSMMPGIAAYVGSDLVMGILNCCMDLKEEIALLIDIGTNGEMVIGNRHSMMCLATAAGPAFEGANISCGTGCVSGAINSVYMEGGAFKFTTIGNCEPVGICGSGVIDVVYSSLTCGIIDENGHIESSESKEGLVIAESLGTQKITFNQKDFREVQLAKSAIRSGIEILISRFGCSYEDVKRVYIAGGFGNKMSIKSAIGIGLIPSELENVVISIGNSALGGSVDYILDKNNDERIQRIIQITEYIEISKDQNFNTIFIDNLTFGR